MACLSDIDLATLHRSRLEERVHYKLSSWNRDLNNNNCINKKTKNTNSTSNVNNNNNTNHNNISNNSKNNNQKPQNKLIHNNTEDDCDTNFMKNRINNSNATANTASTTTATAAAIVTATMATPPPSVQISNTTSAKTATPTNKINLNVNKTNLNSKSEATIAKFKNCDKSNLLENKLIIDKAKEKYFISALDSLQKSTVDKNFNYNIINVNKTERLIENLNLDSETNCKTTDNQTNDIDFDDFPTMRRRRSRTWP